MKDHKATRIFVALVTATLLLSMETACKKKKHDHDKGHDDDKHAQEMKDDWKKPKEDTGDILSQDLKIISEKYLHDIHFDFDKSDIRDDAKPTLEENATFLKKYPTIKIVVEGHCDERGSVEYNLALGERRAKAAKSYLATLGVNGERMTTVSYGKELPLDPGHDEGAWSKNRRAHFLAVSK
ncbi:MAG: peptidoglycan-associated lipoprotein Pal [Acidobacteriota bacterium]